ncbi:hypothetical protein BS47DRAFT_1152311 [Hydnum rufescens UP504]|uniref:Uncharacterized protein n=1 Tax=Hydnum rufescens UP504 TaxID=1448309 RepID=A0A9P6B8Q1_9AGAM|nr:hypothetical protein BS47DRAFT_1152311 [Hydnum rufescens UP504]
MDDDPWRNPFAESLKEQRQPVEASSSRAVEWRSPIVDAAELDIASSTFEPSAWDIERSNTVEWTPGVQDSTPGWEPAALEGPGWTSYTVDADEDVGVHVPEKRNQDIPESPTVGPAAWMESLADSRDPEPHVEADEHPSSQSVPSPSPPSSPLFGTFESASSAHEGEQANAWIPSVTLEPGGSADPWGSTWAESAPHAEGGTSDPPKDEWEAAAAVRQQRDNVVAPEELNGWIEQLEVAVEELWPSQGDEPLDPNWRISLQDVPGLSFLSETFLPELELSRLPSYAQTAVSKSSVRALKLTRHLPSARSSPLSILRIQKEATSWEQSVKRDPKRESVDWGWMVPPTDTSATRDQEAQIEVKKSGGIFSFLGRKSAAVAPLSATIAAAVQPGNSLQTSTPLPRLLCVSV